MFGRWLTTIIMTAALVACDGEEIPPEDYGEPVEALDLGPPGEPMIAPPVAEVAETSAVDAIDPRVRWCEPLIQAPCETTSDCLSDRGGYRRHCSPDWWSGTSLDGCSGSLASCLPRVCAMRVQPWSIQRKTRDDARVVFDHLGLSRPVRRFLLDRMTVGSSNRRSKRHRLSRDREAATAAYRRRAHKFEGNPAAGDPDRWATGLGVLEMNPAIWLDSWDPLAPPETLCGLPEALITWLRRARSVLAKLEHGIDCDGDGVREWRGSGEGVPTLYDLRRLHSGKLCPGPDAGRAKWRARMREALVDPDTMVRARDLGRAVDRVGQNETANKLRSPRIAPAPETR